MFYGWFMVFNDTFNNISVISWRTLLLDEETGVSWRKPPTCRKITNFNVVSSTPRHERGLELTTLVVQSAQVVVNPSTIWSWPWQPLHVLCEFYIFFYLLLLGGFFSLEIHSNWFILVARIPFFSPEFC